MLSQRVFVCMERQVALCLSVTYASIETVLVLEVGTARCVCMRGLGRGRVVCHVCADFLGLVFCKWA